MLRLIRKTLTTLRHPGTAQGTGGDPGQTDPHQPGTLPGNRQGSPGQPRQGMDGPATSRRDTRRMERYQTANQQIQQAVRDGDAARAADITRQTLPLVADMTRLAAQQGRQPRSIPALEQGGIMLALQGDSPAIDQMERLITSTDDLHPWQQTPARLRHCLRLFPDILRVVRDNPGCLQHDVKHLVAEPNGRLVTLLVTLLARDGQVIRTPRGRTYSLRINPDRRGSLGRDSCLGAQTAPGTTQPPDRR